MYVGETRLIALIAKVHWDLYCSSRPLGNGHCFKVLTVAETCFDCESTVAKRRDASVGEITGDPDKKRADISCPGRAE